MDAGVPNVAARAPVDAGVPNRATGVPDASGASVNAVAPNAAARSSAAAGVSAAPAAAPGAQPQEPSCQIVVNGETIVMKNKKEYIFVDIFDYILFDLSQARGRMLVTQVNGEDAQYTQLLHTGDKIDIYWKEN